MFGIDLIKEDKFITIKGISASDFINDIRRVYKFSIDKREPEKVRLFFKVGIYGVLFKAVSLTFHSYFSLEMYYIFSKLYSITSKSVYNEACELLKKEPNVAKYFTPILPLPTEVASKLDSLEVPLFPFQRHFMESYYNAREKLGFDGYLLAFEQGLGKTFTCIAASYAFNIYPAIITAPKSTLDGWRDSIVRMVPGVKPEEVRISYDKPNKSLPKWKYYICNYERLELAHSMVSECVSDVKGIFIDEVHNFRSMSTNRTTKLLEIKNALDVHNIIAISGTPIKALAAELIPVMKLIDPDFDNLAEAVFKRIYSRDTYDSISGSVLKERLNLFIERRKQEDSIKLPEMSRFNINVKLKDPTPYLVSSVKDSVTNYVNQHLAEARKASEPSFNEMVKLVNSDILVNNLEREQIDEYIKLVRTRMQHPMDEIGLETVPLIRNYEVNVFRKIDSPLSKEIVNYRKHATSYAQILFGKAMGQYYVQGKVNLISQMVKENAKDIADIINKAEKKVIIFSTYVNPLVSVKESLEEMGIGCILHTGGDDIRITRDQFEKDEKIKCLLGTTASIGTGTDGLQFISNVMIFLNQPYRSADTEQCTARIHRKGQTLPQRCYFMHLNTGEELNILESESIINEWSRQMFNLAID